MGQVATGTPPLSTVQASPAEAINLASLNVHLAIPIREKAGRGLPFIYKLSYDTSIWYPTLVNGTQTWQPTTAWGWSMGDQPVTGYVSFQVIHYICYTQRIPTGDKFYDTHWTYHDPSGTSHPFPGEIMILDGSCGSSTGSFTSDPASDGSGYSLTANPSTGTYQVARIDGTVFSPPVNEQVGSASVVDSNGNEITTNGSTFTDTLGQAALTVSGSGTPSSPYVYSYQGPSQSAPYTINYTAYTVKTNFGCSGVAEFGPLTENLITSIVLPDGNKYTFTYEQTPGYPGDVTGRLASISTATDGTITYAYTGGNNGIDCSDGSAAGLTRTVNPGGTWTYARSNSFSTTTVTDPQGNQTVINFQGGYETQRQVYNGSSNGTPLETVGTCYNGATPPCTGNSVSFPVTQRTVYTAWSSGQESETNLYYDYNSGTGLNAVSLVTEEDDYGYGSGQPGALMRKTVTSYASLTGIYNRPSSISVYNPSGVLVAQTNYSYDQTGVTGTSGTPQHVTPSGARGNPTTISRLVQGSGYVNESLSYFDTGNVYQATDSNGNVTTYSYGSSGGCGNSFLTSVTSPLSLGRSMNWDCNGGVLTSESGPNGNQTSFAYDTNNLYLWRLTNISYPDGGWKLVSYPSLTETDTYTGITDATPSTGCSYCRHDQTNLDGFGRLSQSSLVNDPDGETTVTTTYDANGRVGSVTNPERTVNGWTATNGTTSTGYDALNRPTSITQPDGNVAHVYYGGDAANNGGNGSQSCPASTYGYGYPALTIDASGMKRQIWSDGLGRTIEVDEPDSSNNLTQATCDAYDANGNLTQVVSPGGQTRSYSYDGLGHVTAAATPESGATSFQYDNNGNLISKTDARGVTTTYAHDALNRLTSISYSDATPGVSYYYDQSSYNGLSISNGKGRRTGMSDGSGATAWSYDAMGRIATEEKTIAGVTKTIIYGYNRDSSLASITYPDGRVVNYSYSDAERPLTAQDGDGTNYAGVALYAPNGATYWPQGALSRVGHGPVSGGQATLTETWSYNPDLEATWINLTNPSATLLNMVPVYTANGSLSSLDNDVDTGRSESVTYDPLNRVLSAQTAATSGQDCWGLSFGSGNLADDPLGNLLSMAVSKCSGPSLSFSVNGNNQINNAGFSYDAAGNMTADGQYGYGFNGANEITSANGVNYTYDGNGLRVEKSSGVLYWRSYTGQVIEETDTSGSMQRDYIFFDGRTVAWRDSSGNVYYYFADATGSTRIVTDSSGNVCFDADYYPYGQENDYNTTCTPEYKFAGYEFDSETGNYYAMARYYSPRLGRFMSPDPLGGDVLNPQSLNRYAYVMNNPVNFMDPLGLKTCPASHLCIEVDYLLPLPDMFNPFDESLSGLTGVGVGGPVTPGTLGPRGGGGRPHPHKPPVPRTPQSPTQPVCSTGSPNNHLSMGDQADAATINPFTSGGGGVWGANRQSFPAVTNNYTYSGKGVGLDVGVSLQSVWAWGSGSWSGPFHSVNWSIGVFTGSVFWTPGKAGWIGGSFGLGLGFPGVAYEQTNYTCRSGS